jgi:hypothetical protein
MTGIKKHDWRDCIGQYALYYWVRMHHIVAIVLCVLYALAGFVCAALFANTADILDDAAAATDAHGNSTAASLAIFNEQFPPSFSRYVTSTSVLNIIVAVLLVFTVSGFLLFFPACIVMFRRVERRLETIVREMDHRPDHVNVLLPYEFSANAGEHQGVRSQVKWHSRHVRHSVYDILQNQVEMQAGQARAFLGSIKSAAVAQKIRFVSCLVLELMALAVRSIPAVFSASIAVGYKRESLADCADKCGTCQSVQSLMYQWYSIQTHVSAPLVYSLSSTLPLVFALWLMTTKKDRQLMVNPDRFRVEGFPLRPSADALSAILETERKRMGIDLS